jgi:hypothetical protein
MPRSRMGFHTSGFIAASGQPDLPAACKTRVRALRSPLRVPIVVSMRRIKGPSVPGSLPLLCAGLHPSCRDYGHSAVPTVCDVEDLAIGPQRHGFRMPTDGNSSDD